MLDSKIACHLCNPKTDGGIVTAQAFQAKGKFMPYFVRHDLVIRILHDKTDFLALCPVIGVFQGNTPVKDLPACISSGCQYRFQLTEQRTFSTAASAADHI